MFWPNSRRRTWPCVNAFSSSKYGVDMIRIRLTNLPGGKPVNFLIRSCPKFWRNERENMIVKNENENVIRRGFATNQIVSEAVRRITAILLQHQMTDGYQSYGRGGYGARGRRGGARGGKRPGPDNKCHLCGSPYHFFKTCPSKK